MKTTTFICELEDDIQFYIYKRIELYLTIIGTNKKELADKVNEAMCGRLCDIEDAVNLTALNKKFNLGLAI